MNTKESEELFAEWRRRLAEIAENQHPELLVRVRNENPWFMPEFVRTAAGRWAELLAPERLASWLAAYQVPVAQPLTVGVVAAGNIPLVAFHDLLAVLAAGHRAWLKLSSRDTVLLKWLRDRGQEAVPELENWLSFPERINQAEAYIATGSDNTARYFRQYLAHKPNIIRQNRVGVAVLQGDETETEIAGLAEDIFLYFGLGCRNVAKLMVPRGFHWEAFLAKLPDPYQVLMHYKYSNNYDYHKSISLVNRENFQDSGTVIFRHSPQPTSPLGVVHFEEYVNQLDLQDKLQQHAEKWQVIIGRPEAYPGAVPFGQAQNPGLADYADGVDTLAFLQGLTKGKAHSQ